MEIRTNLPKKIVNREITAGVARIASSRDKVKTRVDTRNDGNSQTHYLPSNHPTSHLEHTRTDVTRNIQRKDKYVEPTTQYTSSEKEEGIFKSSKSKTLGSSNHQNQ
ncbi:hypothetical protein LIER_32354 [Lithospermum erythrorhizon]|uniref:Uncharacterized protein n=1 Tax=Lithospermum erythrorhizon TaxID=34254 RepID=A0AAV3RZJ0_LITER